MNNVLCHSRFVSMNYFFNSTEYGIYEPHCGLDNVMISWGHDEYLYQVLKNHGSTIPEEGLAMIRYSKLFNTNIHAVQTVQI